jgi:hypothetical protein
MKALYKPVSCVQKHKTFRNTEHNIVWNNYMYKLVFTHSAECCTKVI